MPLLDLIHPFSSNTPVFPGDPKPEITQSAFLETHGFNDFTVKMGMHVGTHIDAPLHFIAGGKKLSDFGPDKFIGRGLLLDARGGAQIDSTLLKESAINPGDILLVHTGWGGRFHEPEYFKEYPVLTEDFARAVIKAGVKIVALDTCSPDRAPYEVHKILLAADVLIVENGTNFEKLLGVPSFEVIALPPFFETEAAPVRLVAQIPDEK
jgi:kynurenine formamidase